MVVSTRSTETLCGGAWIRRARLPPNDPSSAGIRVSRSTGVERIDISARDSGLRREKAALFGRLRTTGRRVSEPDGVVFVVDAVPEPASTSHLVLPLLHLEAVDDARGQTSFQRMLSIGPVPRLSGDAVPGSACVCRGGGTHLIPAFCGVAGAESEVPAILRRRWCDALATLGHSELGGRRRDRRSLGVDSAPQPAGQFRVGVDLGARPPLA